VVFAVEAAFRPRSSQVVAPLNLVSALFFDKPDALNDCALRRAHLRFLVAMNETDLQCDGCGQAASPEHIAKRLQRLEWTTRFRPLHIGTLLLGAIAPRNDNEFIYSPAGAWDGEAKMLLDAAG